MENLAMEIERAVDEVNARVARVLQDLDIAKLPFVPINSLDSCDKIPPGIACLYFVRHPSHGLLYVGKAGDSRQRWRAYGRVGQQRTQYTTSMTGALRLAASCWRGSSWIRGHMRLRKLLQFGL